MALNSLYCADVPLSNYSLTHSPTHWSQEKHLSLNCVTLPNVVILR